MEIFNFIVAWFHQLATNYDTLVALMEASRSGAENMREPVLCFWPMLAMAAVGALQGKAKNDAARAQENSDRQLAAETQKYSWITGNQAGPIRRAGSMFGDIAQGGVAGGMGGMNMQNSMAQQGMWDKMATQGTFDDWNKQAKNLPIGNGTDARYSPFQIS